MKPFAAVADEWLVSDPAKRPRSVRRDRGILDKHIKPVLGPKPIGLITRADVQRLVNKWANTHAPRTVERRFAVLRAVMAEAETAELIGRTPCRGIKLPQAEPVYRPVLDSDRLEKLTAVLDADQAVMMYVGVVLGLRWSECAGLTVGSLNFLQGELSVLRQLGAIGNLAIPKSTAGVRTMAVPDWLMTELSGVLARRGLTGADSHALVIVSPAGAPLHYSNWRRRVWIPATDAAGLPGLHFHDLRSNAATALVDEGVNVKVAQTRLGHTDVRTTLRSMPGPPPRLIDTPLIGWASAFNRDADPRSARSPACAKAADRRGPNADRNCTADRTRTDWVSKSPPAGSKQPLTRTLRSPRAESNR